MNDKTKGSDKVIKFPSGDQVKDRRGFFRKGPPTPSEIITKPEGKKKDALAKQFYKIEDFYNKKYKRLKSMSEASKAPWTAEQMATLVCTQVLAGALQEAVKKMIGYNNDTKILLSFIAGCMTAMGSYIDNLNALERDLVMTDTE